MAKYKNETGCAIIVGGSIIPTGIVPDSVVKKISAYDVSNFLTAIVEEPVVEVVAEEAGAIAPAVKTSGKKTVKQDGSND